MKKLTLLLVFCLATLTFVSMTMQSETIKNEVPTPYCEGFDDGFCEGWKDVKGEFSICPVAPVCPVPQVNCGSGYKCGYNRGFKAGMKKANE